MGQQSFLPSLRCSMGFKLLLWINDSYPGSGGEEKASRFSVPMCFYVEQIITLILKPLLTFG